MSIDINKSRSEINKIDDGLVKLFCKRMDCAAEIARYKQENNLPVYDREREREVMYRIVGSAPKQYQSYVHSLYNTLFALSKAHQYELGGKQSHLVEMLTDAAQNTAELPERAVVACQGAEGAYSQLACEKLFTTPSIMYVQSFDAVFNAVESGLCRYGILPVENSTAGSVNNVYSLMQKHNFYICASVKMYVNHALMALPGTKAEDIKEVISHEQALAQCAQRLAEMKVKTTVCANTAVAAQTVKQGSRHNIAAICSADCAMLYGLQPLASNIADNPNNYTRFICISKTPDICPGANRTSLMVHLPHKPGALYNLLSRFAALDINLTKLESRPLPDSDFEFMFYFDLDISAHDKRLISLLGQLENEVIKLVYLGSYKER